VAVVLGVEALGSCKTTSSEVGGLVWTRVNSFMGSEVLGAGVLGVVLLEIGEISTF
jgi:hypothetical protein